MLGFGFFHKGVAYRLMRTARFGRKIGLSQQGHSFNDNLYDLGPKAGINGDIMTVN